MQNGCSLALVWSLSAKLGHVSRGDNPEAVFLCRPATGSKALRAQSGTFSRWGAEKGALSLRLLLAAQLLFLRGHSVPAACSCLLCNSQSGLTALIEIVAWDLSFLAYRCVMTLWGISSSTVFGSRSGLGGGFLRSIMTS